MQFELVTAAPTLAFGLAVVATVAYVLGQRASQNEQDAEGARRELKRAKSVIRELETISQTVRQSLATHRASILDFKERVSDLGRNSNEDGTTWKALSDEAEQMLKPTMRLSTQIAHAYDEIRQQANLLMTFTEVRTDTLTGLSNRRAMEETLQSMFALNSRYGTVFAVAILDIDHFKAVNDENGHLFGDQVLRDFSAALDDSARETDIVVRFGGEEFVVIMPETDLAGACIFTERYRAKVEAILPITVSAGVTAALPDDSAPSLLTRADTALYSAKSAGRNCVFQHCGQQIEPVDREAILGADEPQEPVAAPGPADTAPVGEPVVSESL